MFAAFKSMFTAVRDLFSYPSAVTLSVTSGIQTTRAASLSADGETLWVGGSYLYKVNTSDFSYTTISVPYTLVIAPTPDGASVYCGQTNGGNVIYKVDTTAETYTTITLPFSSASVWDMEITSDSQFAFIAVTDSSGAAVYRMRLSDHVVTNTFRPAGSNSIRQIALRPDDGYLYVNNTGASPNGWICLASNAQATDTLTYNANAVGQCSGGWSSDSLYLYTTAYQSTPVANSYLYKFNTGTYSSPLATSSESHSTAFRFPVASPEGARLYCSTSQSIQVFDAESLNLLDEIAASTSTYAPVEVSPDGSAVYSAGTFTAGWYKIT